MTTQTLLEPTTRAAGRPLGPGLTSAGLITVLLGAALPLIDFFIVNVALPTINADLNASTATLELVVAGYGIAYALLLVVGGRLGDAFGRRRLFMIGLTAFTVSSLACGLAPDALTLVLARAAQGASAAMMLPQVLSIIQATTEGERRSKALGLYGATGGISTVIGQLLGGVLVAADIAGTSWRPIFLVNVPIGLIGLLLAKRTLPETRSANPMGVDRWGTVLLGVTLLTLLIPLMEGRALGWPVWAWLLLAASPFAAAGFLAVERRLERAGGVPLLPPSIMRMPSMRRGLAVGVPFFTGFGGFMFVYAVTLQDGLHLGPMGSGLALTPMAIGFFGTSLVSSRLVARFGQKVVVAGAGLQAIGILSLIGATLLSWPEVNALDLAPGMLLCGIGQGMAMTTLFRIVLSRVPAERAGVGSGVLTTTQQTSLALGVATLGSLFASLSHPDLLGMRDAFVLVMAVQAAGALLVLLLARALPDPRV
ncbi:MFS transporter [Amycolatopsis anabasis]|uniref:MFS transporter n=1 Tax=Amycolatopsis anabasis TaxID=1840409 RepID=UPI00131DE0B3|nr:MFS transporter [Amycolatopsis anabasis]